MIEMVLLWMGKLPCFTVYNPIRLALYFFISNYCGTMHGIFNQGKELDKE